MTRWDAVWGGGVLAVLAVLCTQVVRSVREVLEVERVRRARVGGSSQSKGVLDPDAPAVLAAPGPAVVRGAGGFLPAVGPSPQTPAERVVAELEGWR